MGITSIRKIRSRRARNLANDWLDAFVAAFAGPSARARQARQQYEAHILDAISGDAEVDLTQIEEVLEGLGDPVLLAREWSESEPAASQPKTFNRLSRHPGRILQAISITLSVIFAIAGLARLADPSSVGLFLLEDNTLHLGTLADQAVQDDLLGPATTPVFWGVAIVFAGLSSPSGSYAVLKKIQRRFF